MQRANAMLRMVHKDPNCLRSEGVSHAPLERSPFPLPFTPFYSPVLDSSSFILLFTFSGRTPTGIPLSQSSRRSFRLSALYRYA